MRVLRATFGITAVVARGNAVLLFFADQFIPEGEFMLRKTLCLLSVAAVVIGPSLSALAETSAEDALSYRKSIMTSLRGHIGAASMISRGLVDNHGQLVGHAEGLAAGVREMKHIFQEGSNVEDSDALPIIWEEPEAFAAAIEKAEAATAAFVEAAKSGDEEAIRGGFRNVGMSCRGCHDRYRVPQD